ncbi:hypothetical protein IKN40_03455, partial [bacterium]|nr:hypothetical protein [bacterium]
FTSFHFVHVHVHFLFDLLSVTALAFQSTQRLLVGLLSNVFPFELQHTALSGFNLQVLVQLLLDVPLLAPSSHSSQPFNDV